MKLFLSGDEAIARGAYEYGATFAAAYPGTPSTEIVENLIPVSYTHLDVYKRQTWRWHNLPGMSADCSGQNITPSLS